ncbi:hydrocarbon binding protein [Chromohalobacter canadensis]|uniref:Hydrocarbon binding protein n=1 Tax=Chromohalobacter moromii TaxID=2860329 RepID=A0A9X2X0I4_9GAMM|nr:hydrocarbon binding protein [Chromohalobacter canadensis]MCT8470796.1 hydrocarbon binding protein [Chromohalobacter canadensis]MCT8497953.1 hydrocarbon binding protein [Chromohalobacter canadensis]MCT8504363.1 hydrocarbon binding protein [Chromohalobacter moromii]
MTKMAPELPIEVDSETGVWTTDALPMLYVPRHFFINNHMAVEEALGAAAYADILYQAGYKSAWHWCAKEAELHGLEGVDVFEHYMKRLSQRGWGRFFTEAIDLDAGTAQVRLEHSAFVYQLGKAGRKIEYMFTGWFAGAMDQILAACGSELRTVAEQTQSAAEPDCDVGRFQVTPRSPTVG